MHIKNALIWSREMIKLNEELTWMKQILSEIYGSSTVFYVYCLTNYGLGSCLLSNIKQFICRETQWGDQTECLGTF